MRLTPLRRILLVAGLLLAAAPLLSRSARAETAALIDERVDVEPRGFEEKGWPPREIVSHFFVSGLDKGSQGTQTVVGSSHTHRVVGGDTLLELARQYDLGYNEILGANPVVDPWLPDGGVDLLLPSEWILPSGRYEGLVVNIPEMRLYYYLPSPRKGARSSTVITYPVGLGRQGWQTPEADFRVRGKTTNPTWVIPASIRAERLKELGRRDFTIAGGDPENPLGRHRIELTLPSYAIHGTNKTWGVGMQVSHGCVRLYPEDIEAVFPLIKVGSKGRFTYQPVEVGLRRGRVLVEVHEDIYGLQPGAWATANELIKKMGVVAHVDPELLEAAIEAMNGIPTDVGYVDWPEEDLGESPQFNQVGDPVDEGDGKSAGLGNRPQALTTSSSG